MDKVGNFMKISAMLYEKTAASSLGDDFANIQIRLLASRRWVITPENWTLDLLSPFWRLYVNHRSGAGVMIQGKFYELEAGVLYLIPAWLRFETRIDVPVRHDYLHFYLMGVPPVLHEQLFDRMFILKGCPELTPLRDCWQRELEEAKEERLPQENLRAQALICAAMARVWEMLPKDASEAMNRWLVAAERVGPALDYLEKHPGECLTNAKLSRLCRMSEDYFIRIFRKSVGVTPARYSTMRRLDVAARWLVASNRTVEDIAEAMGFADRFHFSRVFRKAFGVPPVAYRQLHLREKREAFREG